MTEYELTNPNPGALIESLRSVGYNMPAAISDIVDNSLTANACNIWIDFHWDGTNSLITILDDGCGMSESKLNESMRPGSNNPLDDRHPDDLGRFGLGLKTASFSQCRNLAVWSKRPGYLNGRRWDLNYVSKHNEWRLLKEFQPPVLSQFGRLKDMTSGTLVIWTELDRIVGANISANNHDAHLNFLALIKEVKDYLSMIFHRLLSGNSKSFLRRKVNIYVNGSDEASLLYPWDPFKGGAKQFPDEEISYRGKLITVRGYVMPHKDRLDDNEFAELAGPKGWLAQQGFYIYRNDRILVAGDWLRLGRERVWKKEEQYKLARLSIDIPNSMDFDWSLDVKKSNARPPAGIKSRLTDIGEVVRTGARRVFAHRGQYGPRPSSAALIIERPWEAKQRSDRLIYRINRSHPMVADIIHRLGPLAVQVEPLLRLIEETVPVERIWLDKADEQIEHSVPYEGLDQELILADIRETYCYLRKHSQNIDTCRAMLLVTAPFDRFPELIEQVITTDTI